jgi:hypothetical protein
MSTGGLWGSFAPISKSVVSSEAATASPAHVSSIAAASKLRVMGLRWRT